MGAFRSHASSDLQIDQRLGFTRLGYRVIDQLRPALIGVGRCQANFAE